MGEYREMNRNVYTNKEPLKVHLINVENVLADALYHIKKKK